VALVDRVQAVSTGRANFNAVDTTISITGPMNKALRRELLLVFARVAGADTGINRLYAESNGHHTEAPDERPAFIVPNLGLWVGDNLLPFDQNHYFHIPWQLEECDPSPITELFQVRNRSTIGQIDVGDDGQVFSERLQSELSGVIYEAPMTRERLIKWLDKRIEHPEVRMSSAVMFIENALQKLEEFGHSFERLVQHKYGLKRALARLVQDLRRQRGEAGHKTLIETRADKFQTSADIGFLFKEDRYGFNWPYDGPFRFQKHLFPIVGDLKSTGEEFECACHLDGMEQIAFWVRNVDRKPNSFWLQTPNDKFYPDFVARLKDGRTFIVEYKGEYLVSAEDAQQKELIGKIWAEHSEGACLFVLVSDRNFHKIDTLIAN
jgi:type III restriction enzyme